MQKTADPNAAYLAQMRARGPASGLRTLDQATLARLLALQQGDGEGQWSGDGDLDGWAVDRRRDVTYGQGVDDAPAYGDLRTRIYRRTSHDPWKGDGDRSDVYDDKGNFYDTSSGDSEALSMAKFIAGSVGGYYAAGAANAAMGAGTGVTAAETLASGYGGLTEGATLVGDSVLTSGGTPLLGTTMADVGVMEAAAYGTGGLGAFDAAAGAVPPGGNTPPPGNQTPPPKPPPYTATDAAKLASTALKVAGGTGSGNGPGDGGDGVTTETDQRLIDAQLRSMDTQEALMQRMISNADMIMPFQRESLDFGLQTAREAYGDYRADRTYALGRRDQLTSLQDRMVADARNFENGNRSEELAGMAIADVNRGFTSATNQVARNMTRRGMDPNDGRWGSTIRQLVADRSLNQASAANSARADARKEGYALTDRAAGALGNSPGLALQTTGAGADAGGRPLGMTNTTSTAINNGLTPAAQLAGQWGNNATSMYRANQSNNGGDGGHDWAGYGALLAGGAKLWDAFGS